MNDINKLGGTEMFVARQASKASIAFGAVLSVLGIFAVLAPLFTGVAVTVLVGILLLVAGIVEIVFAFKAGSFGKGVLRFLFGGLGVLAGVIIMATPGTSLVVLAYVLAVFFVAGGLLDIVLSLKVRPEEGWGWMLFSGIVSVVLGGLIIGQWPVSGVWAVGLYVGIRMVMHGWMLMALGRTGQETLTYLQDARIERLENHVRYGARALQEAQAALAEHTAMIFALDTELRKKVSSSEIDPAMRDLNQKLGEAREQMQAAASATKESWDKTQNEAKAAFEKLQKSATEIAKRLKNELGLDEQDEPRDRQE
jgi:uncharacterized membrane protein HdeD (DUF308 family)